MLTFTIDLIELLTYFAAMEEPIVKQVQKRRGRRAVGKDKFLTLVAGRIPPATLDELKSICQARNWKVSDAIRAACELLVKHERRSSTIKQK